MGGTLTTILVTHAHADHIGGIRGLRERSRDDVEVLASYDELPNIRREVTHQVGPGNCCRGSGDRGSPAWTVRVIRAGGLADVAVPDAQAIDPALPHRFSGR